MKRIAHTTVSRTVGPRLMMLLCALAFGTIAAGCRVYPEPNRKSIDELYFEALNASRQTPEHTLGLNPSAGSATLNSNLSAGPGALNAPPNSGSGNTSPENTASTTNMAPESSPDNTGSRQVPLSPPVPALPTVPPSVEEPGDEPAPPTSDPALPPALELPPLEQGTSEFPTTNSAQTLPPVESLATDVWRRRVEVHHTSAPVKLVSHAEPSAGPIKVSENFEETDIRQALQVLASQAGVTIIVDEQISGTITTLIEEVPFESALRKVLMPLGLVYRETEDGEFIVAVPDPSSPLFSRVSERMEYRPLHVSPDELLKLLPAREARFLTVVDKRNLMIIEAPKEIADPILERLQQADNPIPQVELEAIVCVIAPDRGFKSGLDWNHAVTLNGSEVFKLGMAGLAFNGQGSGEGSRSAFSNFAVTAAFVKLLAQEGYLSIRAAPRVTARDGEPAKIAITRQSFFSTQPTSSNAFFRQELEEVEAGITMEITPVIRGDNITVKIEKAEVSEDIRTTDVNAAVANNPFPLINRRTVSTTVSVRDAETIVIGGLVQRQTVDRISKVPVLGDIPYAGRLFQTVEQLEQDAEVVIFISPRIVTSGPSCTPAVEEVLVEEVPPTE